MLTNRPVANNNWRFLAFLLMSPRRLPTRTRSFVASIFVFVETPSFSFHRPSVSRPIWARRPRFPPGAVPCRFDIYRVLWHSWWRKCQTAPPRHKTKSKAKRRTDSPIDESKLFFVFVPTFHRVVFFSSIFSAVVTSRAREITRLNQV